MIPGVEERAQGRRPDVHVERVVDPGDGVAAELGERGDARGGDRGGARHRLQQRQTETFVQRGDGDHRRPAIEGGQRRVVGGGNGERAGRQDRRPAGEDERDAGVRERTTPALDERSDVLARIVGADVQDVRTTVREPMPWPQRRERRFDPERRDRDALGCDGEVRCELVRGKAGIDEDPSCAFGRSPQRRLLARPHARVAGWEGERHQVVHRRHRGRPARKIGPIRRTPQDLCSGRDRTDDLTR